MTTEIQDALRDILRDENLEGVPNAAFEQHNRALSKVMGGLSVAKTNELQALAMQWSLRGYPPSEQAKLAKKLGKQRLKIADLRHFKEMGMLCITFAAWRASDGQVIIRVNDNIADNLRKSRERFIDEQEDLCKDITAELYTYVSSLVEQDTDAGRTPMSVLPHRPDLQVTFNDDGFPILPKPVADNDEHIFQKKTELEDL
ncbi:hypothetical protein H0H81_009307, partial [Sphagnurus paluster]